MYFTVRKSIRNNYTLLSHEIEVIIQLFTRLYEARIIIENYIRKNFSNENLELEGLKLNLELKEYELTVLKKEIQELRNYSNLL